MISRCLRQIRAPTSFTIAQAQTSPPITTAGKNISDIDKFQVHLLTKCIETYKSLIPLTLQSFHLPKKDNDIQKRGAIEFVGGVVLGLVCTNFITSIFQRLLPNHEYNEQIRRQSGSLNMLGELDNAYKNMQDIDRSFYNIVHSLGRDLIEQRKRIDRLVDVIPDFTWTSVFVQNKLLQAHRDIKTIMREAAHGRVATEEMGRMLNISELKEIEISDTSFEEFKYTGGEYWFKFTVKTRSKDTKVYKVR